MTCKFKINILNVFLEHTCVNIIISATLIYLQYLYRITTGHPLLQKDFGAIIIVVIITIINSSQPGCRTFDIQTQHYLSCVAWDWGRRGREMQRIDNLVGRTCMYLTLTERFHLEGFFYHRSFRHCAEDFWIGGGSLAYLASLNVFSLSLFQKFIQSNNILTLTIVSHSCHHWVYRWSGRN